MRTPTGGSVKVGGVQRGPRVMSWNAQNTTAPPAAIDKGSRSGNARPALVGASHFKLADAIIVAILLAVMIVYAEG